MFKLKLSLRRRFIKQKYTYDVFIRTYLENYYTYLEHI